MANATRDDNYVPVVLATSSSDGVTPLRVKVNASTHVLMVSDNTTGSDLSGNNAARDANYVPVLMGVSSADGITPTPIYVNTDGQLLIDST